MAKEVSMERCTKLYNMWKKYTESDQIEQGDFVRVFMLDTLLKRAYEDLQCNYTEEHAATFIRGFTNSVAPSFGLYETDDE